MCSLQRLPVKVTDSKRQRKIGLTVSSLAELKKKANALLRLTDCSEKLFVSLEDGTEVCDDSYLLSLKSQSLLVVSLNLEEQIDRSLHQVMERYLDAVHELQKFHTQEIVKFLEEKGDEKLNLTWRYVSTLTKNKSHLSSLAEHPEWFKGCNKLVKTKEEYFRKCAQGRIRSYLRDAKTKLTNNNLSCSVIDRFKSLLERQKYYACYFDRSDDSLDRICDPSGRFQCEGKYNEKHCSTDGHTINPYDNAESRILFSTWNLDHVVERVNIIADLCHKTGRHNCNSNNGYYHKHYELLFTRKNLKLVHKTCHVIAPHTECKM